MPATRFAGRRAAARLHNLALACGWLLAGLALLVLAVWTLPGQWADARLNSLVLESIPSPVRLLLAALARDVAVPTLALVASATALVAALRGGRLRVLMAVLIPAVSAPLALWLRDSALARPALGVDGYVHNTFPSVHATFAFALLAVIVLLWPATGRRWPGVVVALTGSLIALGNVTGHDHRPADVLGSALLVGCVAYLWAALAPADRGRATDGRGRAPSEEFPADREVASLSR